MTRLAVIHTVVALADSFKTLLKARYPALDSFHVVDESLLQDLLRDGPSASVRRRVAMHAVLARDAGATVILFTCSSTSPAVDDARPLVDVPILKIDDPMAERAVSVGRRIGVVCTTRSTQEPSDALLRGFAARQQKSIEIVSALKADAYEARLAGDQTRHDRIVTEAALSLAADCDVVVLAQASLAHLAPALRTHTATPVLASPELCIESLAQWVET
jgi:Asp/Glu/hydantoin racemase